MTIWILMIETGAGTGIINQFGGFPAQAGCALVRDLMMRAFMDLAASPASIVCAPVAPGVSL